MFQVDFDEASAETSDQEQEYKFFHDPTVYHLSEPSSAPNSCTSSPLNNNEDISLSNNTFLGPLTGGLSSVFNANLKRGPGRPRKEYTGVQLLRKDGKLISKKPRVILNKDISRSKIANKDEITNSINSDGGSTYLENTETILEKMNIDHITGESIDKNVALVEELPYFPEKYPGKVCILCNLSERSQLGQGEMLKLEISEADKNCMEVKAEEDSYSCTNESINNTTSISQLHNRRLKGINKAKHILNTSEYIDELEIIGYIEPIEFTKVQDLPFYYVHRFCMTWSFEVQREINGVLANTVPVVAQSLKRRCSHCSRYGASIVCKMLCPKFYHLPCIAASGGLQVIQSFTSFCGEHLVQGPNMCANENIVCRHCSHLGDLSNLIMCSMCGDHYHGMCIGVKNIPGVRAGWQCKACSKCQICRVPDTSEGRSLACEQCHKVYHAHCFRPIMASIPKYGWKCVRCRVCSDCGSRTPGAGASSRWHSHYTVCDSCYQQRNKGFSCPICHRAYRAASYKEMVKCNWCNKFVHSTCDSEADLSVYHAKKESNPDYDYICPPCKSCDQGSLSIRKVNQMDDENSTNIMELNFSENDNNFYDKSTNFGHGKGKPYAAIKLAKKRFSLTNVNRGKGKFLLKKKARLSEMNRKRGPKSKLKGLFGSGMNLQRPNFDHSSHKLEEEPGIENKLVLCSAKDRYVLTQDICIMCGALGTDEESCLISCTQCGQCYHPYCVSVKITNVILKKGWRCLDCTICEGCGQKNDEARLILCDECDISYHIYCTDPPLDYVPQGNWKCKWCASCQKCGSNSPGKNCLWKNSYSECGPCSSQSTCPVCSSTYLEGDLIIQCSYCNRWLHCKCDSINNEEEAEMCNNSDYNCILCRPKDKLPFHLSPSPTDIKSNKLNTSTNSSVDRFNDTLVNHTSDISHFIDGVCLSDEGFNCIKMLQTEIKKRRKPKGGFELAGNKTSGIFAAIESVVSATDNSFEDAKIEVDLKDDIAETYKDGMIWTKSDASPPQGFTVVTNEQGIPLLRKKRQRNLQKLGIGGFNVRNRTMKKESLSKDDNDEAGDFPITEVDRKRKTKKKVVKSKLIETYPEYLQEAFFGKGLLEFDKAQIFESDSADDENKQNVNNDNIFKLSREELQVLEVGKMDHHISEKPQTLQQSSIDNVKGGAIKVEAPDVVEMKHVPDALENSVILNTKPTGGCVNHKDVNRIILNNNGLLNKNVDLVDLHNNYQNKNTENSFCNNLPSRENLKLNLNQLHNNSNNIAQPSGILTQDDTTAIIANQHCGTNVENNNQNHGSNHNTNDNNNNSSINNSSNNIHNVNPSTSGNIVDSFKNILNNKFYNYDIVKSSGIKEADSDALGNSLSNENVTNSLDNFSSVVCNDDPLLFPPIEDKSKALIAPNYYDIHQTTHLNPNDLTSSLEKTYSEQMVAENFNSGGHFNHNLLERELMTPNENISSTRISEVMDTSFELQNNSPHNLQFDQCYPSLETMGTPPAKAAPKSSERMRRDEDLGEMATISAVLYANTVHPELRHDFPEWNDRCKQICKRWRVLSNDKKAPFLQQAKDNRSALRMNKDQIKIGSQKRNSDGQEKLYNEQQTKDKLYLKSTNDLSSAGSSTSATSAISVMVPQKEFIDITTQQKSFVINKFNSADLRSPFELHNDNLTPVREDPNLLNKPKEEPREDINMYARDNLMSHENAGIGEVNDILGGFAEDDEYELLKSITAEIGDDFNLLEYADPEIDSLTDTSNQNLLDKLDFTDVGGENARKHKMANNSFLSGQTLRERLESSNTTNITNMNYNPVKNVDDNKSHCEIKPPPPPPYPGLPPPYPVSSDNRQEQPLLLEDLLEEERREKRNELALNKEANQNVAFYNKTNRQISQTTTSSDYINWNKQPMDIFDSTGNIPCEPKVDVKKPILYQLNLPPQPPSPPLQILTNSDRLKQIKYEEWLTFTNNQLDDQLKYYEDEIAKLRKSRKTLNSKRRIIKKNGGEITQEITSESSQLTSAQAVIQKQLEYARKQSRQHSIFVENYNSKHNKMTNASPNCQSPTSNISNTSTQSTHQSLGGSSDPYPQTTQSHYGDNIILLNKNTIQSPGSAQNPVGIINRSQIAMSPSHSVQRTPMDRLPHQKLEEAYCLSENGISSTAIPNRLMHTTASVSASKPNNYHMNTFVTSQNNGSQKFINYDHLQLNKVATSPSSDFSNNVYVENNRMDTNDVPNMDSSIKMQMQSMEQKLAQRKINSLTIDQMRNASPTMLGKMHFKSHSQSSTTTTINRSQAGNSNMSMAVSQTPLNLDQTQQTQSSSSGLSNLNEGYFPVTEHFARFGRIKVGLFGGSPINSSLLNPSSSKTNKTDFNEKMTIKTDKQKQMIVANQKSRILDYDDFSEKNVVATEVSLNSAAQNLTDIDDIPVMPSFVSSELSDLVLSSPLESDVAEDYMLFSSHVVDYADSDDSLKNNSYISSKRDIPDHNYPASTTPSIISSDMHTYSRKCSEIPPKNFLSEPDKITENGTNNSDSTNEPSTITVYKNFSDNNLIVSKTTASNTLPTNIISCSKITTSDNSSLANTLQNTTTLTTTKPHTVVVKAKKIVSDVTQTTAKVSIGNTTISVPLLKPLAHIITNDKHHKLPTNVNLAKQPTIYVRGQKINPTIVSLSQIKPVNNAKIVQATVVGKKVQLQQTFSESSLSSNKSNVIHTYSYPNLSQDLALPNKIFEDESTSPKSCSSTHSEIEPEIIEKPQTTIKKITVQKISTGCGNIKNNDQPTTAVSKIDSVENVNDSDKSKEKLIDTSPSVKPTPVNQNISSANALQLSPLSKPTEMATNMANVSQQLKTIMSNLSTSKMDNKSSSTNQSLGKINTSAGAFSVTKLSLVPVTEIDTSKSGESVEQPPIVSENTSQLSLDNKHTISKSSSLTTFNIVTSTSTASAVTNVLSTTKNTLDSSKQKEHFSLHIKRSKSTDDGIEKEMPAQITNAKRHSFELYPPKAEYIETSSCETNVTNIINVKTANIGNNLTDEKTINTLIKNKLSHMYTSGIHNQPKSEEAQNVLLKKLLQSSSNDSSNNMVPSNLTGRNVTSLRAPSLGIVSTLEAQLARPVIPPVPANPPLMLTSSSKHTTSINTKPLKNYQKPPESEPAKPKSQFFTKETSFVSNPCVANVSEAPSNFESKPNQTEMPKLVECNTLDTLNSEPPHKKIVRENVDVLQSNSTIALTTTITTAAITTSPVSTTPNTMGKTFAEKLEQNNLKNNNKLSDEYKMNNSLENMSSSTSAYQQQQLGSTQNDLTTCSPNQNKEDKIKIEADVYNANAELRKKRKREYQKQRRQQLNKDVPYKKKTKKVTHIDEDYDRFIDNLLIQIRQMLSLQVLEPLLNRNYGICPIFGSGDISEVGAKDYTTLETDFLSGEYGSVTNESLVDIYNMKPFGPCDISEKNKSDAIQNGFYDQEFTPIKVENETNQIRILHNILKDKNLDTAENIVTSSSPECTDWDSITSYPHIRIIDESNEINLGSLSPTLPIRSPTPKHKYGIHLYINSKHEKVTVPEVKRSNQQNISNEMDSNMTVTLTLTSVAAESIIGVLKALADVLHISAPTSYRVVERINTPPSHQIISNKQKQKDNKAAGGPIDIQTILNGSAKFCRHCDIVIMDTVIHAKSTEFPLLTSYESTNNTEDLYFCSKICYQQFKWRPTNIIDDNYTHGSLKTNSQIKTDKSSEFIESNIKSTEDKKIITDGVTENQSPKLSRFKHYTNGCFHVTNEIRKSTDKEVIENLYRMGITVAPSRSKQVEDSRQCVFCRQKGDGVSDGPSRLLNFDVDKWVHLNCALWSDEVYETVNGALMNLNAALQASINQTCTLCHDLGATIKCFKNRCINVYHLSCAMKDNVVFYKNKTTNCSIHASKTEKENILMSLNVLRRVYVERDECGQVASVMHHSELSNLIRVGSLTFLSVGQLLPHQLQAFHTTNFIYPIGYKIIRFYWSMRKPNKRCRYVCSIADSDGMPEFRILVQETEEDDIEFKDISPKAVWQRVLEPIAALRKNFNLVQLFPKFISGEDLFGLTEPALVRILESLPGIESLTDYRFKYGRNPLLELPLAINPSGSARTEQKQKQAVSFKKPHTQRTGSAYQRIALPPTSTSIAGEVTCPYSKQFVHSKSSQYKKMKQEWRNNVFLARSKIQGLGLYAARDLEKHTMVIEYIGEVIRSEVSEIREKQYQSRNRGIYMFRLDGDRVIDATLCGGLARYINHSCNPNCVTEIVEVDREYRIIIFAKRRINRGEELSYDYKFDIEDDAHKISCMCGAPNCKKWMN